MLCASVLAQNAPPSPSDGSALRQFYERVRPALVAVQYQWDGEMAKRQIIGGGIVVRDDGLIMIPLAMVDINIPDVQMKNFKILVPSDTGDPQEIPATFLGRDERTDNGYVLAKGDHKWTAIHFEDVPLEVGQTLYGVGILPKAAGYKAYLTQATVSAQLRGEVPQVMIAGGLGNVGSPVFDAQFRAVGVVEPQEHEELLLDEHNDMTDILVPPHYFVPAKFFLPGLQNPDHLAAIPWIGVPQMTGVSDQVSQFLGLKDQPAVQIGEVVPGTPAAKAGLEPGTIVVKVNGQPLERGDLPDELPMIFHRQLMRMKVGDKIILTILPGKDMPTKDVAVNLDPRPRQPSQADRFFVKDLGFVAREAVFVDNYTHKMKPDISGVVVDSMRRDGAAATAKLAAEDWILQLNGQPITDLAHFKTDYQDFRKAHPHDEVVFVVHRRTGQEETVNIEPPQTDASPEGTGELP
jgi:serine protease Do